MQAAREEHIDKFSLRSLQDSHDALPDSPDVWHSTDSPKNDRGRHESSTARESEPAYRLHKTNDKGQRSDRTEHQEKQAGSAVIIMNP
jgi:hypothetical protein